MRHYTSHAMSGMPMIDNWDEWGDDEPDEMHHPNRRGRKAPVPKAPKGGEDLLAQFEAGIRRIGTWLQQGKVIES